MNIDPTEIRKEWVSIDLYTERFKIVSGTGAGVASGKTPLQGSLVYGYGADNTAVLCQKGVSQFFPILVFSSIWIAKGII